jgi:hypothetical protein
MMDPQLPPLEYELNIPGEVAWHNVPVAIESTCASKGLYRTLVTTLKKYPGCVHWHYKNKPGIGGFMDPDGCVIHEDIFNSGTVEITAWEEQWRVWVQVRSGREAPWTSETAAWIANNIEKTLHDKLREMKGPSDER